MISGTAGYEKSVERFLEVSRKLEFAVVNRDFLAYLPVVPARVLDLGSGAGQNAAALAELGHAVVAVEPMRPFLWAARENYSHLPIDWMRGSLPLMACLGRSAGEFDFILIDGVWHHLNQAQRDVALCRVAEMLAPRGKCAISLRNGPPGMGSCVYPTSSYQTIQQASVLGLRCMLQLENQPSILANKSDVVWSRLVLEKSHE
ncbi:MAG: class I SAM-dependent methyltransferase [Verrucomicrobiota bacterium]